MNDIHEKQQPKQKTRGKTMTKTTKMNKNMLAAIIFGEYGWNFIFVNPKTKEYLKSETVTKAWLNKQGISINDFTAHCWDLYNMCKNHGIESGLVCFFDKDDEAIYKLSKTIDVKKFYDEVFDF